MELPGVVFLAHTDHALVQAENTKLALVAGARNIQLTFFRKEKRVKGTDSDRIDGQMALFPQFVGQFDGPLGALRDAKLAESAGTPSVKVSAARDGKRVVQPEVDLLDERRAEEFVKLGHLFVHIDNLSEAKLVVVTAAPDVKQAVLCDAGRM